jgi:hypothetical protein
VKKCTGMALLQQYKFTLSKNYIMRRTFLFIAAIVLFQCAGAQSSHKDLAGVWSLVAVENIDRDGGKTYPYGAHPEGMLVFTSGGEYAIQILKAGRPKVAAKDKNKATPEENAALVQGNNSHFGSFTADEKKGIIRFNIEHAFYPNWEGTVQERNFELKQDTLKYVVTQTTNGGTVTAVVTWKRKQ